MQARTDKRSCGQEPVCKLIEKRTEKTPEYRQLCARCAANKRRAERCGRAAMESRPRRAAVYSICELKVLLDERHQFALTHGAGVLTDDFAVLVDENRRNAANVVFGGDGGVFVHVVLGDHGAAVELFGSGVKRRGQHTAGAAPGSPEVDEDGLVGHVLHGVLKVGIGRGEDEFAHDFL